MTDISKSIAQVKGRICISPPRIERLADLATEAMGLPSGEFWECGVFRGGSARLLANLLRAAPRTLRLFDTFRGFVCISPEDSTFPNLGMFTATSTADVRRFVDASFAVIHEGRIPATFVGLGSCRVAFLHLNLNLYAPTKAALEFALPRMVPGGVIVIDDCGDTDWPGVCLAVEGMNLEASLYSYGEHDCQGVIRMTKELQTQLQGCR